MGLAESIKNRRSIRRYKDACPEDSQIKSVLDAGRWAPSGLNNQPWRFAVVKDADKKDLLAGLTKYGHIIKSAPCLILVFLDLKSSYNRDKDILAIGACIQNMLLMIAELNLAGCWLGEILINKSRVNEFLKISSNLELLAVLTLGYADEKASSSRKAIKDLVIDIR
jgi:nitroreductase